MTINHAGPSHASHSNDSRRHGKTVDAGGNRGTRILVLWNVACTSLIVAVFVCGAAFDPKTIEAERLLLRDAAGNVRMQMEVRADGHSALQFVDANGTVRSVIGLSTDGVMGLEFHDTRGNPRMRLSQKPDRPVSLVFLGSDARTRIHLDGSDTDAHLSFRDRNEKSQFILGLAKDEAPVLIMGAGKRGRLAFRVSNDGASSCTFNDAREEYRLSLGTTPEGKPELGFYDENNALRFFGCARRDGSVYFDFYDKDGKVRHSITEVKP